VTFTSDQVTVTILVVLLGLIAIIVAMRIRRSAQPRPKLSAAYAGGRQRLSIERDAAAALAARHRRAADYPNPLQAAPMRSPSSETWGAIQARSGDDQRYAVTRQDQQFARTMATADRMHNFAQQAEDLSLDHPDVVQYL
jgi:hypothetical protein